MPKVRTTMRPFEVIEVSPIEAADLARQGLLVPEPVPAAQSPAPVPGSGVKKAASSAATKEG